MQSANYYEEILSAQYPMPFDFESDLDSEIDYCSNDHHPDRTRGAMIGRSRKKALKEYDLSEQIFVSLIYDNVSRYLSVETSESDRLFLHNWFFNDTPDQFDRRFSELLVCLRFDNEAKKLEFFNLLTIKSGVDLDSNTKPFSKLVVGQTASLF
jgi:hypothetical protein